MTKKLVRIAAVMLSLLLIPTAANAGLTWDPGSIRQVYKPTGNGPFFYAYAPSAIESGSSLRFWTCRNTESGVIRDDSFYTRIDAGRIVADRSALAHSSSGWDSFHICDPSVTRVNAAYNGVTYRYAMFYLGNDVNASEHNQVGVAYANSLEGPWVRYPRPLVAFAGADPKQWGAGQPSATTINPNDGTALLFWTEGYGSTKTYRAKVDLDGPAGPVVEPKLELTTSGLRGTDGSQDWLNNADFAYDPTRDRFYAVREQHPYPSGDPNYIGTNVEVVSIPGANVWAGGGSWTAENTIGPALTGFGRNHNAGLVRTEYGTLPNPSRVDVLFTTACGDCADSLWQYKLSRISGAIS